MTATATRPQLKAAATATFLVFGISGLVFASWAARIPAVTEVLNITPGFSGKLRSTCTSPMIDNAMPPPDHRRYN